MKVFVIREDAPLQALAEQARITAVQSRQLAEAINHLSEDRDDFQEPKRFTAITNLTWLLEDLLDQQELLCERLESATHETAQSKAVQL